MTMSSTFSSTTSSAHGGDSPNAYPYTRSEECSWNPEEIARNLSSLLSHLDVNNDNSRTFRASVIERHSQDGHLLTRGWNSRQIRTLRLLFGNNEVNEKDEESPSYENTTLMWLTPILKSFLEQMKEPLILMLLVSAAVSLILEQYSDAISITIALTIVSLVAAVQEYRSEKALEKLTDLVPHTCTVLRDGKMRTHFLAKDLVVGDLVLLGTGEYVLYYLHSILCIIILVLGSLSLCELFF